jgi:hypothetical protein
MLGKMIIAATVAIFVGGTAAAVARTHASHHGYGYGAAYDNGYYGYGPAYGYDGFRNDLHHPGDTNE